MSTSTPPPATAARLIGFAILAGGLLFGIVIGVLMTIDVAPIDKDVLPAFAPWVGLAFSLVMIPVAFALRNRRWSALRGADPQTHGTIFVAGSVLFFAILEAPTLLNLVFWLLSGELLCPVAAAIPWAVMASQLPSQFVLDGLTE